MDFTTPPKRTSGESIVPMINVVFLLLIFFLMTSEIKPPEPFEITLPSADGLDVPQAEVTLHISKEASVRFEDFEGDTAWARLGGRLEPKATVKLQIDAELPATDLARVLRRLATFNAASVEIVAVPQ